MYDLSIELTDEPGALATMGETLGRHGVAICGGGVFVHEGRGIAHFLFEDGGAARGALYGVKRLRVVAVREVLVQRLRQGTPGQLGMFARRMADAGINIQVQYSDHDNQLVVVVDDPKKGRQVSDAWELDCRSGT